MSICGIMFGASVCPGFASGTQTVSYFLTKGWIGVFIGPLLAGLLCFIFCFLLFDISRIYKPKTYREAYDTIYQSKGLRLFFGNFKEVQVVVVILIALSAQISTSAILLNQVFGLPLAVGSLIFCAAGLVISIWGSAFLRKAGSVLSICILLICVFIAVVCLQNAWPGAVSFLNSGTSYTDFGYTPFSAWFNMLMIVVFFMNGYEACVPASIGIINTRRDVLTVAGITALLCSLSTVIFTVIFASGMPEIVGNSIPTLWAIDTLSNAGRIAQIIYVVFALAAMLSSCAAFIFTVCDRFERPLEKVFKKSRPMTIKIGIAVVFILICTFGSTFGLLNIIKYGYTTFTSIVGPVMLIPLVVSVPYRLYKDKKIGSKSKAKEPELTGIEAENL